jgi:hypothetical protein
MRSSGAGYGGLPNPWEITIFKIDKRRVPLISFPIQAELTGFKTSELCLWHYITPIDIIMR